MSLPSSIYQTTNWTRFTGAVQTTSPEELKIMEKILSTVKPTEDCQEGTPCPTSQNWTILKGIICVRGNLAKISLLFQDREEIHAEFCGPADRDWISPHNAIFVVIWKTLLKYGFWTAAEREKYKQTLHGRESETFSYKQEVPMTNASMIVALMKATTSIS
ncbi:hypothetical protein Y032_0017g3251 [Ancylostoma ceylanicum]|uniref:Uncharacterized protein n=1 Tax=Ancylostoma ceylanicum TaxID=53326 RepID=A0A016V4T1_9BILA|nr:hypothetical protein Y032_0017g3251 [Ancylostoma ceylanicum]